MKRFIMTVLGVAVFFVGLGALVDKAGAHFKSDEKALDLVAKARQAIGGDAAIANVQSLRIVGNTTKTLKLKGGDKTEQGETEIALQFPDKLMKMTKLGDGKESSSVDQVMSRTFNITTDGGDGKNITIVAVGDGSGAGNGAVKHVFLKKADGAIEEVNPENNPNIIVRKVDGGNAVFTARTNETVTKDGKLMTITRDGNGGDNVRKVFVTKANGATEEVSTVEGQKVVLDKVAGGNVVFVGKPGELGAPNGDHVMFRSVEDGSHFRHDGGNEMLRLTLALLLSAPKGMDVSYTFAGEGNVDGTACNIVNAEFAGSSYKIYLGQDSNLPLMLSYKGAKAPMVVHFRTKLDGAAEPEVKQDMVLTARTMAAPETDSAEYNVKFTDFRSVGGVQLPYKWTQTVGGAADETFDVTNYEVNPANIAEKFHGASVMVRTAKPINK